MAAELFNKPRITAKDDEQWKAQVNTFLYQLVEQLNWAFNALPGVGIEGQSTNTTGSSNSRNGG